MGPEYGAQVSEISTSRDAGISKTSWNRDACCYYTYVRRQVASANKLFSTFDARVCSQDHMRFNFN